MPGKTATLTAVTPVVPVSNLGSDDQGLAPFDLEDATLQSRVNLTRPTDKDNELIKVASVHGPPGILAVLRSKRDYGWFVILCFRAIEVNLQRNMAGEGSSEAADPVAFGVQMLEMEMIDEIFQLMKQYEHLRDVQRSGLSIIEMLVADDPDWRDEVARKGGVTLLCDIAKKRKDIPAVMCQVMTCMAYIAAEDYIEVMLCQHDALEYVAHIIRQHARNAELVTRASLALLNLTVCEPHIEELMDKEAILPVLQVMDFHVKDIQLLIILCGVLANFSVKADVRQLLVDNKALERIRDAMKLDPANAILQVAGIKALVNYSTNAEHYMKMEDLDIPTLVGQMMVDHAHDPGVQKYGNYYLGRHSNCPIL